jgi:hypothetical protein
MHSVVASLDRKTRQAFRALAEKSNESVADYLRRVVWDYLEHPEPIPDNLGPVPSSEATSVATRLDDQSYRKFMAQVESRGLSVNYLLRMLVHEHVDSCAPETYCEPDPRPERKPMVYLDHKPASWLRPIYWSSLTAADIERVTGCSNTAAYKLAKELAASERIDMEGKALVLRPEAQFEETADQFFENLLSASLSGMDPLMTCGATPPVSIKLPSVGIQRDALKVLLTAMNQPNQLVDALVRGTADILRFAPLEFVFDGQWMLRANEFMPHGGLIGEKAIPLADIDEADLFVPAKTEPPKPKRPGRKPRAEPETYDKDNRLLIPAGTFEVGVMLAGKIITKLGKPCFDPEFDRVMQYAYFGGQA